MPALAPIPDGWEVVSDIPDGWEVVYDPKQPFDPEGSGYDYETAQKAGLEADDEGMWPIHDPKTGRALVGTKSESWKSLDNAAKQAGYAVEKGEDGNYYTKEKPLEYEFEGTIYEFSPNRSHDSIKRFFDKLTSDRRTLKPEQAGGRSMYDDSETNTQVRSKTPLGEDGRKSYADMLSGMEDEEANPIIIKPEDVTPQLISGVVEGREQQIKELKKRKDIDPVWLQEFTEDTEVMKRDLDRRWDNETTDEHYERYLDSQYKPEDIVKIAKTRTSQDVLKSGDTVLPAAAGVIAPKLKEQDYTPEEAKKKLLDWRMAKRTPEEKAKDDALLESRHGLSARKKQPWTVNWSEGLLREYASKYGEAIPQEKQVLFEHAKKEYEGWLKKNPKAKDDKFDAWRQNTQIRELTDEDVKAAQVPYEQKQFYDTITEAMVARHAYHGTNRGMVPYLLDRLPFAGTAVTATDLAMLRNSVKRIEAGEHTDEDLLTVATAMDAANENGKKGLWRQVWDLTSSLPAMGAEFALTGGAYTAARAGARNLGVKALGREAMRGLGTRLATKAAGVSAGVAAQTAINVPLVASKVAEKWMPEYKLTRDEAGQLAVTITDDPSLMEAGLKGLGAAATEMGSERAGAILGLLGKTKAGQVLAKLPGAKQVVGVKAAIVNKALAMGLRPKEIAKRMEQMGWHGVLEEFFEERAADVIGGATGIEDDFGTTGQVLSGDPRGFEQLAVEALSFAALPIMGTIRTGAEIAMEPQEQKDANRVQGLKDKLKAGGSVSREDANALKRRGLIDITGLEQADRTQLMNAVYEAQEQRETPQDQPIEPETAEPSEPETPESPEPETPESPEPETPTPQGPQPPAPATEAEDQWGDLAKELGGETTVEPEVQATQPPRVGEYVQWTSDGTDQFTEPRRVEGVSPDGKYVFIKGEKTGIPVDQVRSVGEQESIRLDEEARTKEAEARRKNEERELKQKAQEEVREWKRRTKRRGGRLANATIGGLQEAIGEALSLLGLKVSGDLSPEAIHAAYLAAAKNAHPDRGGSTKDMARVNKAYELLKNAPATIEWGKREWANRQQAAESTPGETAEQATPEPTSERAIAQDAPEAPVEPVTEQQAPEATKPAEVAPPTPSAPIEAVTPEVTQPEIRRRILTRGVAQNGETSIKVLGHRMADDRYELQIEEAGNRRFHGDYETLPEAQEAAIGFLENLDSLPPAEVEKPTTEKPTEAPTPKPAARENPADVAARLKGEGVGRQESWSRWVQHTQLNPGMDAKDWYAIYDSVTPEVPKPISVPKPKVGRKGATKKTDTKPPRRMAEGGRAEDGGPILPGDTFLTSSGRTTTPYPKYSTKRQTKADITKSNQWLLDNAIAEAESRGDDYNATSFRSENAKNLPPASIESAQIYLFGEQPEVPRRPTKPTSPDASTPESGASATPKRNEPILPEDASGVGETNKPSTPSTGSRRVAQPSYSQTEGIEPTTPESDNKEGTTGETDGRTETGETDSLPEGGEGRAPQDQKVLRIKGRTGKVGKRKAHYEVVEARDLIGSHHPGPYLNVDERWPAEWQPHQRRYEKYSEAEKNEANRPAEGFDPDRQLDPTYHHGEGPTMVVERDGNLFIVGGTRRFFMLSWHYAKNNGGQLYRDALEAASANFGIDPAAYADMERPVLIRVIDEPGSNIPVLIDQLNVKSTYELDPAAEAASLGRAIGKRALNVLLDKQDEESISHFLDRLGREFVDAMVEDNPELQVKVTGWIKDGKLTKEAKLAVSHALLGKVIPDAEMISEASPKLMQSVDGALSELIALNTKGGEWSMKDRLVRAIMYDAAYRATGRPRRAAAIEQWIDQGNLEGLEEITGGKDRADDGYRLWRFILKEGGARKFRDRLREYMVRPAKLDIGEPDLFTSVDDNLSGNEAFDNMVSGADPNAPPPKYKVGAKIKSKPITIESIKSIFPGAKITPIENGWRVRVGKGTFTIKLADKMPEINWTAAERALGRKIGAAERRELQAAGSTSITFPDGTRHDGLGLILLHEALADDAVLRHEALHLARMAGIISPAEWKTLVAEHAPGITDPNVQEEKIAQAMEAVERETNLWKRIKSWLRRMLAKLGLRSYQVQDIHQLLRSGGFWARTGFPLHDGTKYSVAYHGTPHRFDKFSTEKIGTGEGAQVYGWGMYFTDTEDIAKHYRDAIRSSSYIVDGERVVQSMIMSDITALPPEEHTAEMYAAKAMHSFADPRWHLNHAAQGLDSDFPNVLAAREAIELIREGRIVPATGSLYKVDLAPEQDEYLLWDKPLSEQSEKVKEALKPDIEDILRGDGTGTKVGDEMDNLMSTMRGSRLYAYLREYLAENAGRYYGGRSVWSSRNDDEATSKHLRSLGIRGIKYLDRSSRRDGEGSYNYVIFDDADVEILERYSLRDKSNAAVKDFQNALKKFGDEVGTTFSSGGPFSAKAVALAADLTYKAVKAGTYKFAVLMEEVIQKLSPIMGEANARAAEPLFREQWEELRKSGQFPQMESVDGREPQVVAEPVVEKTHPEEQPDPRIPDDENLTSIKKEIVNDLRKLVGLPEMEGSTPETIQEWADTAHITMRADPRAAVRLVNELAARPRAITQHEVMLLQFHYRQLANELEPVVDEYFDAVTGGDPEAIAIARSELIAARGRMTAFEEIIHPVKETWGRTGRALQLMIRKDFSPARILRRAKEANHGNPLTEAQVAELTDMAQRLQDIQDQLDAKSRQVEDLERELASQRQHAETVKNAKQPKPNTKARVKAAVSNFKEKWAAMFRVGAVYDPKEEARKQAELLEAAAEVVRAYIADGYVRFKEFWHGFKSQLGKDADTAENVFRTAWTQLEDAGDIPISEIDASDLAALSNMARGIQRHLVEAGMTEREAVIDAVHEIMQEELPAFTRRQTMDALSRYGQFTRPSQEELDKLIRDMNAEVLKLSQIDQLERAITRADELRSEGLTDEEIGEQLAREDFLPKATGLVRDTPTQAVRQLTKQYNELKKSIPATPEGKAGKLQSAQDAIIRSLENRIRDVTWEIEHRQRMVRERQSTPENAKIKTLRAELERLMEIHREVVPQIKNSQTPEQRLAAAERAAKRMLEFMQEQEKLGFPPPQTKPAPLTSEALTGLKNQIKTLREKRTQAQREGKRLEQLDRKIAELERKIKAGDVAPKPKPTPYTTPMIDARTAWRDQLQAELEALRAAKMPELAEQYARKSYEASLRRRIAKYQQTLATEDFAPKQKKQPRKLSPEELKLKREMEDIRHQVLQKLVEYHVSHLTGIAWTADKIAEAAHLSRALMTSFDLSALLRQGGLPAMGHPVLAKRALFETVASLARTFDRNNALALSGGVTSENIATFLRTIDSRQAEFEFMHTLNSGKDGELRLTAGLSLPSTDETITRQEEAFQGRWGKLVPGVAISGRLYTMILNKMRADLFDSMVHNLGRNGSVTMDEARMIANFVNVATGRADFGKFRGMDFNKAASILNLVFFAPRYVASRFQYLAMPFYLPFKGGVKANWQVKRAIYKEYARTAVGIGSVLGTIALAGMLLYDDDDDDKPFIELDPRSSDFLKVRIGETRLDFLAGLSQTFVLSTRLLLPEFLGGNRTKSSATGKITKFGETPMSQTKADVLIRFGRTKLAPVPGAVVTGALYDWENVVGQKADEVFGYKVHPAVGTTAELFVPLSLRDVAETVETQGIPKTTAMSLLAILGVGMSTYGPKTQYVTGTAKERQELFEKDLDAMQWNSPPPAYSEFLSSEQMKQIDDRKHDRMRDVVEAATRGAPERDRHKSDKTYQQSLRQRENDLTRFKELAQEVSHEQAQKLLVEYYRRPGPDGKPRRNKQGHFLTEQTADTYNARGQALARLYGRPEQAFWDFRNSTEFTNWSDQWYRDQDK